MGSQDSISQVSTWAPFPRNYLILIKTCIVCSFIEKSRWMPFTRDAAFETLGADRPLAAVNSNVRFSSQSKERVPFPHSLWL